jgi:hypothetical protein
VGRELPHSTPWLASDHLAKEIIGFLDEQQNVTIYFSMIKDWVIN